MHWWATGLAAFLSLVIFFVIFYGFTKLSGYAPECNRCVDQFLGESVPIEITNAFQKTGNDFFVNNYYGRNRNITEDKKRQIVQIAGPAISTSIIPIMWKSMSPQQQQLFLQRFVDNSNRVLEQTTISIMGSPQPPPPPPPLLPMPVPQPMQQQPTVSTKPRAFRNPFAR